MQTLCNIAGVRISLHIKKRFYNFAKIILFFSFFFFFQAWTFLPLPEEENEVIPPHF